ncbi:hypothetical protein [Sphingomonas trueperi]|uniref:hypothetical protein n=1 Tax=Sphingomonas trueperi TaxID=53317 RepID=UPI0011C45C84
MSIEEQAWELGGGSAEVVAMAKTMVVGQRIIPVGGHLVAVPGQVLGDGDTSDAPPPPLPPHGRRSPNRRAPASGKR